MSNQEIPITEASEERDSHVCPETSVGWKEIVRRYQKPTWAGSLWQLTNTLVPYVLLWVLMAYCVSISYWLVIPLAVLAGGFLVRTFVIFHDCTHGSFFKSARANEIVGLITGILTFTPYHHWRWEHSLHHSTSGDLDRRGIGDVWTLTVQEYLEASRWKRFAYRLARNPIVLFAFAPMFLFFVLHRFSIPKTPPRERRWLYITNILMALLAGTLIWILGIKAYLIIQLTSMLVASSSGVWLFYVQHQFEDAHWERGDDWDFASAALHGSSFYKLPKILQWFSGNIGFHHIHHLSPRIPNYHLERAHKAEPLFQSVKPLTIRKSLKSFNLRLWDEAHRKLVGYKRIRTIRRQQKAQHISAR
ncbi:MAG: fatty acid desaturase [Chthoniobacterales bacterium]